MFNSILTENLFLRRSIYVCSLVLSFLLFSINLIGQENLILNGSFEDYIDCPISNDVNNGQLELCSGWTNPTLGTSDYFNFCSANIVGIPNNFWGHQETFDGDGYVGLVPLEFSNNSNSIIGAEYIQTKLIKELKPCHEYRFSLKVNLANLSRYSYTNIGAFFSKDAVRRNDAKPITFDPQILNKQQILDDTNNWQTIEGTFIAEGGEEFVTIGYFNNNPVSDTTYFQYLPGNEGIVYAYYYLDSASLIETGKIVDCTFEIPSVFTPNGDDINDFLDFSIFRELENVDLKILNRWGNVVFSFSPENYVWDGRDQEGQKCSSGVYFYSLKYELNNLPYILSGLIHIYY